MNTEIVYSPDHLHYCFRVLVDGVWIASVPHYLAGEAVLNDVALQCSPFTLPIDCDHGPVPWSD